MGDPSSRVAGPDAIRLISAGFLTHPDSAIKHGRFNADFLKLAKGNDLLSTPAGTDRTQASIGSSSNDLPYPSAGGWGSEPMVSKEASFTSTSDVTSNGCQFHTPFSWGSCHHRFPALLLEGLFRARARMPAVPKNGGLYTPGEKAVYIRGLRVDEPYCHGIKHLH